MKYRISYHQANKWGNKQDKDGWWWDYNHENYTDLNEAFKQLSKMSSEIGSWYHKVQEYKENDND